ncbi:MAG: hypothetical protein J5833_05890, partial [Victivallales bacterium]|nr:hypothetical protein [Victivallales bacterium]
WRGLDLHCGDCKETYARNRPEYFYDLELNWEHDAVKKEWALHIKANGENAGFQFLDEKLYNAPADGYVKEGDYIISYFGYIDKPPVRHIYLRLRDPGMYARLDITSACADEDELVIKCDAFINPYGDRCLEQLEFDGNNEKAMELRYKCRDDADEAMRCHTLAPRPPFEKWIKEGKVKY